MATKKTPSTNPGMRVSKAWAISRSAGAGRGHVRWYKCFEISQGDKKVGRWCGQVSHAPERYLDFDTGSMWMENDKDRRAVEAAIWDWEATHETVGAGKQDKSTNPRGKHIACGSRISKKKCRQLQHVYTSQKKRGLSDERAAKSAWGSLRNPEKGSTMKTANPAKGVRGEADEIAGDELEMWIDNTEPLYRKWQAIVKNLWRHQAKGRYQHERAVDGFMYLVDDGAKDYTKEFGGKWNEIFDAPTRRYVANEYAKSFENNQRDEIQYAPPGAKHNPAPFDALSPDDQVAALRAYGKGLAAGAAGDDIEWTGRMGAFATAGMNDARIALGGARANNPMPPQAAWVVVEGGKPVGLFFADKPLDLDAASRVTNGPGGRMRNGAGLGAFLGSLSGAVVGTLFAALGAIPVTTTGGLVLAPLSLLLSMAGGAIGGHVGAPRDRKKRGAIGGGIGGVLGPLGAALGGYLGGRKPDKRRRNPAKAAKCGCTHSRAAKLARNICA